MLFALFIGRLVVLILLFLFLRSLYQTGKAHSLRRPGRRNRAV